MARFTASFSGHIRTVKAKTVGKEPAIEVSLCRKNRSKDGEEPKFTWLNVLVYKPAPWQIDQLKEGKFISGSGEFTMRSYEDKNGAHRQAGEVWCSSFDIDGPKPEEAGAMTAPAPRRDAGPAPTPAQTSASAALGDEPPF